MAAKITGARERDPRGRGHAVEAGQVLARLDDCDARVRLASAVADRDAMAAALGDLRVNLANAERDWRVDEPSSASSSPSSRSRHRAHDRRQLQGADRTDRREQVGASEAKIRMAQQDLDNCIVRAPFDGIVVSKDAQRGEMVSPISAGGGFTRTGIATLVDMTSLEIEVDVNESYIARVQPGQPLTAVLDAYPDWQIPAKVRTVIPTADRQKATVKVRATFDELDPRILPDMGVKVTFLGDAPDAAAAAGRVLVPKSGGASTTAASPTSSSTATGASSGARSASGQARGDEQEVIAGLRDGEQVVVDGRSKDLRDGQRVQLRRSGRHHGENR